MGDIKLLTRRIEMHIGNHKEFQCMLPQNEQAFLLQARNANATSHVNVRNFIFLVAAIVNRSESANWQKKI